MTETRPRSAGRSSGGAGRSAQTGVRAELARPEGGAAESAPSGGAAAAAPFALLGSAIFFWGSGYWATEIAAAHAPALMVAAFRAGLAAIPLLAVLPLAGSRLPRGRTALWAAATGVLTVTLFIFAVTEGVIRAGAGNASVLINSSPFFVLVLGYVLLRERIAPSGLLGLGIGFGGVVLMVSSQLGGHHGVGNLALGIVLSLAASLTWALETLLVKALVTKDPGLDLVGFTAMQFLVGGPLLIAIAFAGEGTRGTDWGSGDLWGAAAYLTFGGAAFGTLAFLAALKRLSATRTASSTFLIPALAVLIEIGRGRAPGAAVLAGMVLTILGVALVNTPPPRLMRVLRPVRTPALPARNPAGR